MAIPSRRRAPVKDTLARAATLPDPIDLNLSGAVTGAHSRKDMAKLRAFCAALPEYRRKDYEIVEERDIHRVLKTDICRGAMIRHGQGTIHPGKYLG